jgi:hypothetical protein
MPPGREAGQWLDGQERAERKNARVADKMVVALPTELTPEQRAPSGGWRGWGSGILSPISAIIHIYARGGIRC